MRRETGLDLNQHHLTPASPKKHPFFRCALRRQSRRPEWGSTASRLPPIILPEPQPCQP
nr:MAG TPA: hypothetical protein [Caudoviricetes sp.]